MSKYGKYVVTDLKTPDTPLFSPEAVARYAAFARRILWMDENVVPGAFQMNCSWYFKPLDRGVTPHTHDADEILGFFGNDDTNPSPDQVAQIDAKLAEHGIRARLKSAKPKTKRDSRNQTG